MRFNIEGLLWILYTLAVVCIVGYFAVLLGIFATDAPSTTMMGGVVVGTLIFVLGMVVLIWLPYKVYRFIREKGV